MRSESDRPSEGGAGGWLHSLDGNATVPSTPQPTPAPKPSKDWGALVARFAENVTTEQVLALATSLGVDPQAVREFGTGWNGTAYTFPMFDGSGAVCGIKLRTPDGRKLAAPGSKLGVMRRAQPDDGPVTFTEGESDALAGLTLAQDAIAVPGAGQCCDIAAAYARNRDCTIVADNDEAGKVGAERLARALLPVASSLRIIRPPKPHKDLRDWLRAGCTRADLAAAIEAAVPEVAQPDSTEPPPDSDEPNAEGVRPAPMRFLRPWELAALPPRDLLWGAGLGRGELGMLFGHWGSCKSFVALALAVAIADGTIFLGFKTRPGAVGLIVGEGAAGQTDRLRAATTVARVADATDPLHDRIGIACKVPPLTTAQGFDETVAAIEAMPVRPDLLVLDTVARALSAAGLDENATPEMGLFVAALDRLRARFPGMAILAVHHTGNGPQDRSRGSNVLPSACDFICRTERIRGPGLPAVRLVFDKTKDGELPTPLRIDFEKVVVRDDADGQPVTSLRIAGFTADVEEGEARPKVRTADLLRAAMREAGPEGIDTTQAKRATTKAAATVSETFTKMVKDGEAEPFTSETGAKRWRLL